MAGSAHEFSCVTDCAEGDEYWGKELRRQVLDSVATLVIL